MEKYKYSLEQQHTWEWILCKWNEVDAGEKHRILQGWKSERIVSIHYKLLKTV